MSDQSLYLVADIGGTNARFAIIDSQSGHWLGHWCTKVANYSTIVEAIEDAESHLMNGVPIAAVSFAVGVPIDSEEIEFTNSHWRFSKQQLKQQFNWSRLLVLNDFRAAAYGVLATPVNHHHVVGHLSHENYCRSSAVIGPGTGLGVAGLYPHEDSWVIVPTEAGHARWAVNTREELELLRILQGNDDGDSACKGIVQREDILSGPGLAVLYRAVATLQGKNSAPISNPILSPEEIVTRALHQQDSLCLLVLNLFCRQLGYVVADIAVSMGVRGSIFLAGGLLPRMSEFFMSSEFRQAFESHPRFGFYFKSINTVLVMEENLGLIGAHSALLEYLEKPMMLNSDFRLV
jgi:glucokinase